MNVLTPKAYLEICVADDIVHGLLLLLLSSNQDNNAKVVYPNIVIQYFHPKYLLFVIIH